LFKARHCSRHCSPGLVCRQHAGITSSLARHGPRTGKSSAPCGGARQKGQKAEALCAAPVPHSGVGGGKGRVGRAAAARGAERAETTRSSFGWNAADMT
jgi:hypothetical protein